LVTDQVQLFQYNLHKATRIQFFRSIRTEYYC